ncbi:MAG: OmpA family protein [Leptolyngbya sp. SIO3F4]|nr:OmpA family protein [Leptolyngbya sp. SIO3F4]
MKKTGLFIALLGFATAVCAQTNLVPNGSFETTEKKIKRGEGELYLALPWFTPSEERPADLYNKGVKRDYGIPENKYGYQTVEDGETYAGIRVYSYKDQMTRTWLEVKLSDELVAGKSYCVSFQLALTKISKYSANNVGAHLSVKKVRQKDIDAGTMKPQIMHSQNKIFNDQYLWQTVCGVYKAVGGERYLTIGNFMNPAEMERGDNTERMKRPKGYTQLQVRDAYYYIDDVKVINMAELESCSCEEEDKGNEMQVVYNENISDELDMEVASQLELQKVFFDENSTTPSSPGAIVEIIRLLKDNEGMRVEIIGHSDKKEAANTGKDISEERAKAIYDYLVEKGIDASRLSFKGVKNAEPEDESGTKEGNAKNRRVTFKSS